MTTDLKIYKKAYIEPSFHSDAHHYSLGGYASVFNVVDSYGDIVLPGAFDCSVKKHLQDPYVKFLWQHNPAEPIGVIEEIDQDSYGLKVKAILNQEINKGRESLSLLKQKALKGLSIGFYISDFVYNDEGQRLIRKAELIEVSLVTFPANEMAGISNISTINSEVPQEQFLQLNNNQQLEEKDMNEYEQRLQKLEVAMNRPDSDVNLMQQKASFSEYLRSGNELGLEQKAFANSNEDSGGFLVAPTLQHKIISSLEHLSPLRKLASIENISSNALDLLLEEKTFESGWVAETDERKVTDNSNIIKRRILVHELYAQPKATQALLDDAEVNLENWLVEKLERSFARTENMSFLHGNGEGKPRGILTYKEDVIENIPTKEEKEIAPEDLINLMTSLDEAYLNNATFLMNRRTLGEIQKLQDSNGRFIWQPSMAEKTADTIFGIPVVTCNEMPVMGEGALGVVLADFKRGYKIVDRKGISVMRDPYTDKPFVKFYVTKRVGGDIVDPKAIKFLKIQ